MAKQEEQKQKSSTVQQDKPVSGEASQTGEAGSELKASPDGTSDPTPGAKRANAVQQRDPLIPSKIKRRQLLIAGLATAATAAGMGAWLWVEAPHPLTRTRQRNNGDSLVLQWNTIALQTIRNLNPTMPVAARALAIVHTCMFDAWAAYDSSAVGTQLGTRLRQPASERSLANKYQAISYAAQRALINLFPEEQAAIHQFMKSLGYDPGATAINTSTPIGIGNLAAQAVLNFRHYDGANQFGDLKSGAYSDYTNYQTVNTPDEVKDPNRWQPLRVPNNHRSLVAQRFDNAQWGRVIPFAQASVDKLRPDPVPAQYPSPLYTEQAKQILQYSAGLTDEQKVIAQYWSGGPNLEQPSGHWCLFAQFISQRDGHTLDQNIKLFFILANALLDTSIACWTTKHAYDSVYPLTAIHLLFKGKQVQAWAGPGKGVQWIDGVYWQPYQTSALVTPNCPEYCSEQSAFSAAAAEILRRFTGNDRLNMSYTQPARSLRIESDVPRTNLTLSWHTFSQAADQAGLAGRYSGTHFPQSDLAGRALGEQVGAQVWLKAQRYLTGNIPRSS